jgi:hypothetical protein
LDEKTHEFTNIDREELPAIQIYVKGYLEARQKAEALAAARNQVKVESGVKQEDGSDKEEDDEEDEVSITLTPTPTLTLNLNVIHFNLIRP